MNCTQALEQLLDADLGAPVTERDRALAAHLAVCARCARAAAALQSGTLALAQAVSTAGLQAASPDVSSRGMGWFAPRFVLAGAALGALTFVLARTITTEPSLTSAPVAVAEDPRIAGPLPVAPAAASRGPGAERAPRPVPTDSGRIEPRFFAAEPVHVTAVEATPFVLTNAADASPVTTENRADVARLPEVTVTNRLGTHAMVSRTADPNIVVVWLSAEPNRRNP